MKIDTLFRAMVQKLEPRGVLPTHEEPHDSEELPEVQAFELVP